MRKREGTIIMVFGLIAIAVISGCISQGKITEQEAIQIAAQTEEAELFLEKYPDADIMVTELKDPFHSDARITYRVMKRELPGYIIIMDIFINKKTKAVTSKNIQCMHTEDGDYWQPIESASSENVLKYLKEKEC